MYYTSISPYHSPNAGRWWVTNHFVERYQALTPEVVAAYAEQPVFGSQSPFSRPETSYYQPIVAEVLFKIN
jgi:hypothetical protein